MIRLTGLALKNGDNAWAYFFRAHAKFDLGDNRGAIAGYNRAIAIDPQSRRLL